MIKKTYLLLTVLFSSFFLMTSCLSDDDNFSVDEEWLSFQNAKFESIAKSGNYTKLNSASGDGSVYWQPSTVITDSDVVTPKITANGTPEFTDTVSVRYEGWYYNLKNEKIIFDSTEGPITGSTINPNKVERKFAVNGVVRGWTTLLEDMQVGDERVVVIPQQLGYGGRASAAIPAYTTLFFRIKLFKVIPMSPLKN